ncbi:MAG TPA: hypothetical protein VFV52_15020 [Bacilli bacterium]|nr:hypothetical protein [Bacilli bacterium]
MKWNQITPKQWAILASLLLVLVVILLAYSVFVPKLREVEALEKQLQTVQKSVARLEKIPLPTPLTDAEKLLMAEQVPVSLEQSRLLKAIRQQEADSGVMIRKLAFAGEPQEQAEKKTSDKKKAAAASDQTSFQEEHVQLELEGEYPQVRTFLELFARTNRLISVTRWHFDTEPQTVPSEESRTDVTPTQPSLHEVAWDALLPTPLLRDRTPIYTEDAYNRVVEMIRSQAPLFKSQHDLDIANLEIQQATNRYAAGKAGSKEAITVLDLDRADVMIEGANPNIQEVLGIPDGTAVVYPNGSRVEFVNNPLPLLEQLAAVANVKAEPTGPLLVKLQMDFTVYSVPDAQELLPTLPPIDTYDPANRSNPVES